MEGAVPRSRDRVASLSVDQGGGLPEADRLPTYPAASFPRVLARSRTLTHVLARSRSFLGGEVEPSPPHHAA